MENNKPSSYEVAVPNGRFSQGNMARLATALTANPGGDARGLLSSRWTGALRAPGTRQGQQRSIPLLAEATPSSEPGPRTAICYPCERLSESDGVTQQGKSASRRR